MSTDKVIVTYHLIFQKESVQRSVDLLLAEMTGGIQYYSTRNGMQMERIQDTVPFIDKSVQGEVLSIEQLDGSTYSVKYAFPATNLDVELGGITNLWPIVAGEVFNFHFIKRASLVELELPALFESHYLGPRFGIEGGSGVLLRYEKVLFSGQLSNRILDKALAKISPKLSSKLY